MDPAVTQVADRLESPVVVLGEGVVGERILARHGEEVAHARGIIRDERVAVVDAGDGVGLAAAREDGVPGLGREQDLHPAVRVHAQHGHVGVALGAEEDPDPLGGLIRLAVVGPDADPGRLERSGSGASGLARGEELAPDLFLD